MGYAKICVICGRPFVAARPHYVNCSKECAKENKRRLNRKRNKDFKAVEWRGQEKWNGRIANLAEIERDARSEGLSYGFYVAKHKV